MLNSSSGSDEDVDSRAESSHQVSDALSLVERRVTFLSQPNLDSAINDSRRPKDTAMTDDVPPSASASASSAVLNNYDDDDDDDDFIVLADPCSSSSIDPSSAPPHSVAAALALHEKESFEEIERRTQGGSSSSSSGGGGGALGSGWCSRLIPRGGLISTAASISAATLGSSALIIAYCFQRSAIIPGILTLCMNACFTVYTVFLLGRLLDRLGEVSYEAIATRLCGKRTGKFASLSVAFFGWGCAAVYAAVLKSVLAPFALQLVPAAWVETVVAQERVKILAASVVSLCTQVPLSLREHMNSLRYVATAGTFAVVLLVFCVVHRCWFNPPPTQDFALLGGSSNFSTPSERIADRLLVPISAAHLTAAMGIFVFSYCCQTNCFVCYEEMKRRSASKLATACALAVGGCTCFYVLIGVAGVGAYGSKLRENVIENLAEIKLPTAGAADDAALSASSSSSMAADGIISCISVGITVLGCFPVTLLPARAAILEAAGFVMPAADGGGGDDDQEGSGGAAGFDSLILGHRRLQLGLALALTALAAGVCAPGLVSICSMVGGCLGVLISFILPVYLTFVHGELLSPSSPFYSAWHVLGCILVLVFGAGAGAVGSAIAIVHAVQGA